MLTAKESGLESAVALFSPLWLTKNAFFTCRSRGSTVFMNPSSDAVTNLSDRCNDVIASLCSCILCHLKSVDNSLKVEC